MKKILLGVFLFFLLPLWYVYGHALNVEALIYINQNPNSSWSDFKTHIQNKDDEELDSAMESYFNFLPTILLLPEKKYVINYSRVNPNFTHEEIKTLIQDDPMLWEIWSDVIYNYLISVSGRQMTWSYIKYYIWLWIDHILAWIDHILFICTLTCVPAKKKEDSCNYYNLHARSQYYDYTLRTQDCYGTKYNCREYYTPLYFSHGSLCCVFSCMRYRWKILLWAYSYIYTLTFPWSLICRILWRSIRGSLKCHRADYRI